MKLPDPFFILYEPRSGSTFLANELMRRGNVVIFPETNIVPAMIYAFGARKISPRNNLSEVLDIVYADKKFPDWGLERQYVEERLRRQPPTSVSMLIRQLSCLYLARSMPEAARSGFKKGSYASWYRYIARLFPNHRTICLIRDGRAVFNSQKKSIYSNTGKVFQEDARVAARLWKGKVRLLRSIAGKYPKHSLLIHYEELVQRLEETIDTILFFLEVSAGCETRNERGSLTYNVQGRYGALHENVGKGPLYSRISAWKKELTREQIRIFEAEAGEVLESEGYLLETQCGKHQA